MKRLVSALVALCAATTTSATAQRAAPVARVIAAMRADAVWAPLRFLSDDRLEGRGTGARGGDLAAVYLASQLMALGLEPAGDSGTWYHQVPIVSLNPTATLSVMDATGARTLRYRDDFVAWAERAESVVTASAELVFVGYGITAPEEQWDDYKGMDVRGKIIVMLVNDPGLRDPAIFRGRILTYYGRWTYKLEEAARRGALGVLLVHNDTMATYGWSTVQNSWTGDQVRLLMPPTSLAFAGWVQQGVAGELFRSRGLDLARLMDGASRRDFRPVATGLTADVTVRSVMRHTRAANVVGRLRGSDPTLAAEAVVIGGHYDHLGIGRPVNGDSIMNGALDNASGTAAILGLADAFVRSGVRPKRSLVFVLFTGEEKGLLGSAAFAQRPTMPLAAMSAMLNVDVTNLYGATSDVAALGLDQSTLGEVFTRAARAEGLRVTTDSSALLRGSFFRSDHFPFAKVGVPALSLESGTEIVGRPAGWLEEQAAAYNRDRYHQVDDELLDWYTLDGTLQQMRIIARVALAVGNAPGQPAWNASSEFRAAGEARRAR